ncbi:MAG: TerB family tellurite resistance protein [bacterium]
MIGAIKKFFDKQIAVEPGQQKATTREAELRLRVATCALLLEAAHADDDFSADEEQMIHELIRQRFQISAAAADMLIGLAGQERQESTDLYQFTRLIGQKFDRSQKLAILEQLWRVVYSDGLLEAHEDALMHKLNNLLGLKHQELIALKLRVKKELGGQ